MNISIEMLRKMAVKTRRNIIEIAYNAAAPTHVGPALSSADIVTALYYYIMKVNPQNPQWEERDRFILSKGHACPVIYSVLAEKGFFPKQWLKTVRQIDSHLEGHPVMNKTPGIDMISGSLGNGRLRLQLPARCFIRQNQKRGTPVQTDGWIYSARTSPG
jgi:transketolase